MNYLNTTTGKSLAVAERRRLAFNLRKTGLGYQEVADQVSLELPPDQLPESGYSAWWAHQDVAWVIDKLRQDVSESAADVIAMENARLDALLAALWPQALRGNARSIEVALKIMERRAKMLGLDEAVKVDWRVEIGGLIAAGLVTRDEARNELGDELWAIVARHLGELEEGDIGGEELLTTRHRITAAGKAYAERKEPTFDFDGELAE